MRCLHLGIPWVRFAYFLQQVAAHTFRYPSYTLIILIIISSSFAHRPEISYPLCQFHLTTMFCSSSISSCGKRNRPPPDFSGGLTSAQPAEESARASKSAVVSGGDLLAAELSSLSVQEREKVYEEIHGVIDIPEETPEFVAQALKEMRTALANTSLIPKSKRKAFDRALFLRPSLDTDDKLLMRFLRCERFDGAKAALKICRYYEAKLELWGDDKLVRRITLDDLTEREIELLYSGSYMFLPSKDTGNRPIHIHHIAYTDHSDWRSTVRWIWYKKMSALDDEELQRSGCVEIIGLYADGPWKSSIVQILGCIRPGMRYLTGMPIRACSVHICYDSEQVRTVIDTIHFVAGTDYRVRQRAHFGSKLEAQYALLSFGIPVANAMTPGEGVLSRAAMDLFIQKQRTKEREFERQYQELRKHGSKRVPYIIPNDVMMKRSGRYWSGNLRLMKIVDTYREQYRTAKGRLEKTMLAIEIVQRIQLDGAKFVQRSDDNKEWEVVDDAIAKEKVSQALRMAVLKQQREQGEGTATSATSAMASFSSTATATATATATNKSYGNPTFVAAQREQEEDPFSWAALSLMDDHSESSYQRPPLSGTSGLQESFPEDDSSLMGLQSSIMVGLTDTHKRARLD